jgi:putative ABC transport system substrate-binding protein
MGQRMQFAQLKRREVITFLGVVAAWPVAARAQQPDRLRRIGALMSASENDKGYQVLLTTFREELKKTGWEEGRNIRIDFRVGEGFVAGLPRPGRNVTGFINMEASMSGKWLELLKEITPSVRRVAILFNPATAPRGGSYYLDPFNTAAQSLGIETIAARVHDTSEIEPVIAAQAREPNSGLVVMSDVFPLVHRTQIIALAARYRLPAAYPYRQFAEVGGLLSYGNDLRDNYRRAAIYTHRILRGEQPSELSVEVPVKFELVINLKTAKALGLTIPDNLLTLADEVIE